MRILVIDDNHDDLRLVSIMLTKMGHETCTASSGAEALDHAAELKFDLGLIDYHLGLENGMALMNKIKNSLPDLCFILMTGAGTAELAVHALKQGASDFLVKPFAKADLAKCFEYVNKQIAFERSKKKLFADLHRTVREQTLELEKTNLSVLSTLAQAMEKRDFGTFGHSRRVCEYSCLLSEALGLSWEQRDRLRTAALLHDIGKIGITDFIIGKKGPLSNEEMDVVRTHPRIGVEILSPLTQLEPILPSILHHHERYDGSGYPNGLQGDHIPLHARIIAVADTYDAIMSNRPYRAGADHALALKVLMDHAETQFDPLVIKTFHDISDSAFAEIRETGMNVPAGHLSAQHSDRGNTVAFAEMSHVIAGI